MVAGKSNDPVGVGGLHVHDGLDNAAAIGAAVSRPENSRRNMAFVKRR